MGFRAVTTQRNVVGTVRSAPDQHVGSAVSRCSLTSVDALAYALEREHTAIHPGQYREVRGLDREKPGGIDVTSLSGFCVRGMALASWIS